MEFREKVEYFIDSVHEIKPEISDEESTKHSLVLPFLATLGYNPYDPREVKPEYTADFAKTKRGKKESVDYAILKEKRLLFFVEAKSVDEKLDQHNSQLGRYFNATPDVKISILTNGLVYKFYTDLNEPNIMDDSPFYTLNLEKMSEKDFIFLHSLLKEKFDEEQLVDHAKQLLLTRKVRKDPPVIKAGRPRILDTKRLTVTVDSDLYFLFQEFAEEQRVNKSELIRFLLRDYLKQKGYKTG